MNKLLLLLFVILLHPFQDAVAGEDVSGRPKLIVGIVVDQMRFDYLERYMNRFSDGGFKKLTNEGFNCLNANYDYIPTYTGPGHATIYTGTSPSKHGICGNTWLDKQGVVYCVDDDSVKALGDGIIGGVSPSRLKHSTLSDLIKNGLSENSRVISVALKDRSSVLPAGKSADGAYWYNSKDGNWVSSSFYMKELPFWVQDFNKQGFPDRHFQKGWKLLHDASTYTASGPDSTRYEAPFLENGRITFPYDLLSMQEELGYGLIKSTPHGNTLTRDFAMAAFMGENLGRNGETDFLFISFSSTDYVGHQFGPRSMEVEDTYLRLDVDIAQMIAFVQGTLGKENVLFFLTSDHGAVDVPNYLIDEQKSGGYYSNKELKNSLDEYLNSKLNTSGLIRGIMNNGVYIDSTVVNDKKLSHSSIQIEVAAFLKSLPYVSEVVIPSSAEAGKVKQKQLQMAMKGYCPGRSGQVLFTTKPGWIYASDERGTTHGSGYDYDTHVPLIFYGPGIKKINYDKEADIEQIVPTLIELLQIKMEDKLNYPPLPVR